MNFWYFSNLDQEAYRSFRLFWMERQVETRSRRLGDLPEHSHRRVLLPGFDARNGLLRRVQALGQLGLRQLGLFPRLDDGLRGDRRGLGGVIVLGDGVLSRARRSTIQRNPHAYIYG